MSSVSSRWSLLLAMLTVATLAAGCSTTADGAGESLADARRSTPNGLGIDGPDQLPDPCALLGEATVGGLIGDGTVPTEGDGGEFEGRQLLFRTCLWGEENRPEGAIGVQIGVADADGRDVVANRSIGLEPSLETSIGTDGKEAMYVGMLPTGGTLGSTIYFRHAGYSVMIGHVGPGAAPGTVETLATDLIAALDTSA